MIKWILWIVGALAAIVAIVYGVGVSLPRDHVARAERVIPQPIEQVAARIRDVRAYPDWRNVTIDGVSAVDGALAYVETSDGDRVAYRMAETEPGRRFVTTITDPSLPYGGQWTFTLTPEGGGTRVAVEEDGEIRDPLYRFFARFVFGYTSSMEGYLDRLSASFV